jgi:mRNA interferase YafQ
MRTIERSSAFKRDYKRAKATPRHRKELDSLVSTVVALLMSDKVLPENNRDHASMGDWAGYRECHIKPGADTLRLARLGSHSELFSIYEGASLKPLLNQQFNLGPGDFNGHARALVTTLTRPQIPVKHSAPHSESV